MILSACGGVVYCPKNKVVFAGIQPIFPLHCLVPLGLCRLKVSIVARVFHMEMETISTTEARKRLGCTSQTIRNLIKGEKMEAVQLEKGRGQKDVI